MRERRLISGAAGDREAPFPAAVAVDQPATTGRKTILIIIMTIIIINRQQQEKQNMVARNASEAEVGTVDGGKSRLFY